MPPPSPVPGWSSGDVCALTIATRRTASASLTPTAYPFLARNPAPNRCNRGNGLSIPDLSGGRGGRSATVSKPPRPQGRETRQLRWLRRSLCDRLETTPPSEGRETRQLRWLRRSLCDRLETARPQR